MRHERFRFKSLSELQSRAAELGIELPMSANLDVLSEPVTIGGYCAPNRFAIQPMEGCDGTPAGAPDALTLRRYERFFRGGAGLIWFEATAVTEAGRANPRQLFLHAGTRNAFQQMLQNAVAAGRAANGSHYLPYTVLQLTHSGRYSRPVDVSAPVIAHHDGLLDNALKIPADYPLVSDRELEALVPHYVQAARLARNCGFNAVDIKSCHRYLLNELLAAHTRPGRFGGAFTNRVRLLLDIVSAIRADVPDIAVWVRLNVFDGHPYPWGWGVMQDDALKPDLSEPLRLIKLLRQAGVAGINVTAGNPYYTPHINRPYDQPVRGAKFPDEHPLEGVARQLGLARVVKQAFPDVMVIGSGFSWLRQYIPIVAAGAITNGWMDFAGVGRGAFAYPDFARDVLLTGRMNPAKACITCSRCTQIMRSRGTTGCVMFDREIYKPIYEASD